MNILSIGPVSISLFGLIVAAGAALSLAAMALFFGKDLKKNTLSWFALLSIPLSVLLARFCLCLVSSGWYLFRQDFFFKFSRGGYLLYGAFAGVVLAAFLTSKITKDSTLKILDAAVIPGAFMLAVGRVAEGLSGSGYGRSICEWFDPFNAWSMFTVEDPQVFCRFPFGIQDYYGDWCWSVFLLEAFGAIIILVLLLCSKKRESGAKAWMFLLLYAGMQTWFESLREDSVPRLGFVRINQLISAVLVAVILTVCLLRIKKQLSPAQIVVPSVGILLCAGLIIVMEFALEQKIPFLTFMRKDLCHMVMLIGSLGLILFVMPVLKKSYPLQKTRS